MSKNLPKYTLHFIVRARVNNALREVPVYLRVIIERKKMDISTGTKVLPSLWNDKLGMLEKGPNSAAKNKILQEFKSRVLESIATLVTSNLELSVDNLRKLLFGEQLSKKYGIVEVAKLHNEEFQKFIGIRYSQGSYKNYRTTLEFLEEFIQYQYGKEDLPMEEANYRFCELYFLWLTTIKTCNNNGGVKHIQRLKKIGRYALRMGFINQLPFQAFSVQLKPVIRQSLTWEEIRSLEALELQTPQLHLVRDIFLFQVYTGLCYADVKAFKPKHIVTGVDQRKWIKMERTKTRSSFTLPLFKQALDMIERSGATEQDDIPVFKVMSNQKMNAYLKILQELSKIPKTLHTHLPRHTFATTVMLQSGIPLETISKMMGHSRVTITQVYAKLGELRIAADLKDLTEPGKKKN